MPSPFDELAAEYDQRFDRSRSGMLMRRAVWRRLRERFAPGDHVLELNCGTGEDAVHLARHGVHVLATDASAKMIEQARRKVDLAGVAGSVQLRELRVEDLSALEGADFDGVFSNFGGFNCVGDRVSAARSIARCIRPGGPAVLCVMGPFAVWEWVWYLLRGQPRVAGRRLRPGGVVSGSVQNLGAPRRRGGNGPGLDCAGCASIAGGAHSLTPSRFGPHCRGRAAYASRRPGRNSSGGDPRLATSRRRRQVARTRQ